MLDIKHSAETKIRLILGEIKNMARKQINYEFKDQINSKIYLKLLNI